jgi:hypothetical protein
MKTAKIFFTLDAAQRIVQYLCQNGGVYSKYKDTVKCP